MREYLSRAGLWFLFPALVAAQPFLNLDFETSTNGRLRAWSTGAAGYELAIDTDQVTSGRQSMRIRNTGAGDSGLGVSSQYLPAEAVAGKRVKVSGFMRTEGVNSGYAALWLRVDGTTGILSLDNMAATGPRGNTGWTRYEFERQVSDAAVQVIFGVFLAGRGTAWFDNLLIEIDGSPVPQVEPFVGEPSEEQLAWIRSNAVPFNTPHAGSGFEDLAPVKEIIGNARIVALGEATHGTSEFFRMKHRLFEFLATEMGFTIFSIEANMPEAYRVNDYVLAGNGDPKTLLKGMYFWTWNTQEVLDLIEWMRAFNASGRGVVQFTGFDMQTWTIAGDRVQEFVAKADPALLPDLQSVYNLVRQTRGLALTAQTAPLLQQAADLARGVREYLESRSEQYQVQRTLAEVSWVIQNARIVEQATQHSLSGSLYRDEMMAVNTAWILNQNPDAKAVLWAHNYHVSRVRGTQGWHLARQYGSDYVVLGFAFHEGRYNAVTRTSSGSLGSLQANDAIPSYPGSVEYIFHRTEVPQFILDLRKVSPDNGGAWLLGEMELREIGSVVADGFAVRRTLCTDYDALIFFDQTTPSALLPF